MRVRIRFSKREPLHYIGHLDVMRFFQKAIRRAHLPARFSEGFSPHILLSFASPLGVGKVSEAEYFDLELEETLPEEEIASRLQAEMVPGMEIRGICRLPDSRKVNGMRVIAAASYEIRLPETVPAEAPGVVEKLLAQDEIRIWQASKKREGEVDIRPGVYELDYTEHRLTCLISASSARHVRPEAVLEAFTRVWGHSLSPASVRICRKELYADHGTEGAPQFVSLLVCDRPEESL